MSRSKFLAINMIMLWLASPLTGCANTIAFIFALDEDFKTFKMEGGSAEPRLVTIGSTTVYGLRLGPHQVWAVKMGTGNVATSVNAMAVLSKFSCDLAVSIGPAGALSDDVERGEWYFVNQVIGYQRGTFSDTGWTLSPSARVELAPSPVPLDPNETGWEIAGEVSVASGEAFIAQSIERSRVYEMTASPLVDMNSFGLAQACASKRIPLIVWKVVSDHADSNANKDFRDFTADYTGEGGKHLGALIKKLPPIPNSPEAYEHIRDLLR